MAKIIAITNQKGGVGKTTTAVNLAASFGAQNHKILLLDLDPQGNATVACGVDKHNIVHSTNDVLLHDCLAEQAIIKTSHKFDLIPANGDLTAGEVGLIDRINKEKFLAKALTKIKLNYDFIIIDCPPALNMLTLNALVAANSIIIPIQCEYFALEGLAALMNTINQIKSFHPSLFIEGILRTMFDGRNKLCLEVSKQLIENFGTVIYKTTIPRNVRLAEAPSHGLPALAYAKSSPGACAYMVLAEEILQKQQHLTSHL